VVIPGLVVLMDDILIDHLLQVMGSWQCLRVHAHHLGRKKEMT